jgi:hypothetical protein
MHTLNGKQYKIHTVTQDDIARNDALDYSDLGEKYILLNGCFYFI